MTGGSAAVVLVAVTAAALLGGAPVPAADGDGTAMRRVGAWATLCDDPAAADSAFAALGALLPALPDSVSRAFAHYLRFSAARTLARTDTMVAQAESCWALKPDEPSVLFETVQVLITSHQRPDLAERLQTRGVSVLQARGDWADLAYQLGWLGHVRTVRGDDPGAVAALDQAARIKVAPDPWRLLALAHAYLRLGRPDDAVGMFIRGIAARRDTMDEDGSEGVLDSLYQARHGSREGLAEAIEGARRATRWLTFFELRDHPGRPPATRLLDLRDSTRKVLDLARGITVVDFWGTWCAPCREMLPRLAALEKHYGPRGVRFVTVHVPGEGPGRWRREALELLDRHGMGGAAYGGDSLAVARWKVEAYPTTFVVSDGRFRFRDEGAMPEAVGAQIDSLVRERAAGHGRTPPRFATPKPAAPKRLPVVR